MSINFYLGILLLVFGLMKTGLFFFRNNLTLARLTALKDKFGAGKGTAVYLTAYAGLPVLSGLFLLGREFLLSR